MIRVPRGHGVGLQGPRGSRGSRGRPTRSQGIKGWAFSVLGGQGVGYKVPGFGLHGPRGPRGRLTGSHVVKG